MRVCVSMDINIREWANAIGYDIVGDKLVKQYNLSDFEKAVKEYIQLSLDGGVSSDRIFKEFCANDASDFLLDFESSYDRVQEEEV